MNHKEHKEHYEKTKDLFKIHAIERQGYYDAQPGRPSKYRIWELRMRKMLLGSLDKLLRYDSNISNVIDVGCGRGDFTIEIAKRYPQLGKICGCDFCKEVLSIARKEAASPERISFQEADILDMPFEDNSFDLTLCNNVLHHIHESDLPRALSELARITNRYLIIEIRNKNSRYYYEYIYSILRMKPDSSISVYRTSTSHVSSLLRNHGFQLRKQRCIFFFNRLSPILFLIYYKSQVSDNTA